MDNKRKVTFSCEPQAVTASEFHPKNSFTECATPLVIYLSHTSGANLGHAKVYV